MASTEPHSFWRVAAEEPDRIAIIEGDRATTFASLSAQANQLAHAFAARGMKRGDVVAVALPNVRELLAIYFAAMQSGLYFLPMNPALTASERAYLVEDSRAKIVVDDVRALDDLTERMPSTPPPDRSAGERMSYTSGTTGKPKGVVRPLWDCSPEERAAGAATHLRYAARIQPRGDTVSLVSSPLHHSASLLWCTDHLHLGHAVVLMEKWTPEAALAAIARHRVTSSFMVPTHFRRLLALPDEVRAKADVTSLRHVVHSGAPCPVDVKRRMLAWWGPVIYETYASTEGAGTQISPAEWLAHPGSVGRALDRVRVLREDGSACAAGEIGNIYLQLGPRPFSYGGAPEKTAASRRDDYFSVGDLGYIDATGYLFLTDRSADVIISGGVNVYPAEVEAALASHPAVADCAVIGVPSEEWGEEVRAIVELVPGHTVGADELLAHAKGQLASFKCPRAIEVVSTLPRDEAGKLSRRKLREPYWAAAGRRI